VLRKLFQNKAELKSPRELGLMREAGKVVAEALRLARSLVRPGIETVEIDRAIEELYKKHNAQPLFKGYPGPKVPFPAVTCISVNEQVVHGIPGRRVLREGDIIKLDTACKLNGWCADAAVTLPVGEVRPELKRLIQVAWETLRIAIEELGRRKYWSEVALRMQQNVERAGFSVVTQYVGHGIGRIMHEAPQVPNYVNHEVKKHDFRLEPGLVLAVEPMVNLGRRSDVDVLRDHWTVVTRDRLPSAHVEHTLALTADGVKILTADEETAVTPPAEIPVSV
jgi:methionyl aminopeptidase